jgi:hypothetical protein
MTTILSNTDAATRISSIWKGYQIRKIFSDLQAVNSWWEYTKFEDRFNDKKEEYPSYLTSAWEVGLNETYKRLSEEMASHCQCSWCVYYPDEQDQDDTEPDWHWNDGGGYNDW